MDGQVPEEEEKEDPKAKAKAAHRSSLGSSHELALETHSAVARGVISGRSNPKFCSFNPYISKVYQRLGVDFNLANRFKTTDQPCFW